MSDFLSKAIGIGLMKCSNEDWAFNVLWLSMHKFSLTDSFLFALWDNAAQKHNASPRLRKKTSFQNKVLKTNLFESDQK